MGCSRRSLFCHIITGPRDCEGFVRVRVSVSICLDLSSAVLRELGSKPALATTRSTTRRNQSWDDRTEFHTLLRLPLPSRRNPRGGVERWITFSISSFMSADPTVDESAWTSNINSGSS